MKLPHPKEKAEELIYEYCQLWEFIDVDLAKECSIILVNEILKRPTRKQGVYWNLVKIEIEKYILKD